MNIFKTLLGSGDVVSKGFDLIDSFHTSKHEEIEAKTKAKTDLLSAYAPFKIAQRYLALLFGITFVASYILVLSVFFFGADIQEVQAIIAAFKIDWIMLTIVSFYFGGGAFEGILNARNGAKKK